MSKQDGIEIAIPFDKNILINGNLHKNDDSDSLLIICHGFQDSKDITEIKSLASNLGTYINVFRFTFSDKEPDLSIEAKNLSSVVGYFSKQFKTIIVAGHSLGGLSAILGSINNSQIDKLILINPFVYLQRWVAWRFRKILIGTILLFPFVKRVRINITFYFKTLKPKLIKIPTMVIVSTKDNYVSPIHGKYFFKQLGSLNKKLLVDEIIDHGLSKESYVKRVSQHIINWLKERKK